MCNVDDEKPLTAMIPRGQPPRILAFGHRDTRGHDHQGQRVFGRSVRTRMDNSDHRGQRVYEGSALAVLYKLACMVKCIVNGIGILMSQRRLCTVLKEIVVKLKAIQCMYPNKSML